MVMVIERGKESYARSVLTRFAGSNVLIQASIVVFVFTMWEVVADTFGTQFWTASPSTIAEELKRWALSGQLATDLQLTLTAAGLGFLIGSVVGGLTGFILGWIRRLGDLFEPFVLALYTLPKIALAPLFVLWFGIGLTNKIMFSALLVFFMVFFTTYQGTRQVDRDLVENARLLGAQRWDIWTKIAIPYSAVWVLTGVRIGLPYALIGAIVAEFIASSAGVGYRIKSATSFFNTAGVFAGLVLLMVISFTLLAMLKLVERRVLAWQNPKDTLQANAEAA